MRTLWATIAILGAAAPAGASETPASPETYAAFIVMISAAPMLCNVTIDQQKYRDYYSLSVGLSGLSPQRFDALSLDAAHLVPEDMLANPEQKLCPTMIESFGPSGRVFPGVLVPKP